jgi:hypothetical protein
MPVSPHLDLLDKDGSHPIHISKSAIAALTLPLAPSAIAGVWVKAEKLKS